MAENLARLTVEKKVDRKADSKALRLAAPKV